MLRASLLFLIIGAMVSFWQVPKSVFDADQEYFAKSAQSILNGDLTLLGQQTGIGELYHAPGFNYLVASGMWISHGNPYTIAVIGAIFSTITVVALYVLGSRLVGSRAAAFATVFALTSDQFLGLQSFTQNVAPLTLITLIFLFVLIVSAKGRSASGGQPLNHWKPLFLGLLLGLTLHFHIIGAMLVLPLVIRSLSSQQRSRWSWIVPFLLLASPLILFDIRNDWLLTQHVVRFFTSSPDTPMPLWDRVHAYLVSLSDLIHVGFPASAWITPVALLVLWGLWSNRINQWITITLLTPLIAFLLFRGHLVPYYAIVAWTPFVLISGAFLSALWGKSRIWQAVIVVYISLLSLQTIDQLRSWDPLRTIDKKLAAIRFIKNHSAGQKIYISRTMELATNFGFDYLLWYEGLKSSGNPNDPTYTLVVPANFDGIRSDVQFGDIGVVLPE